MQLRRFALASAELAFVFPAALFMLSLFVRNLQPLQYEPAHSAQQIVDWYAMRPKIGLWFMLIALPLAGLVTGCLTLRLRWKVEPELRLATSQFFTSVRTHLSTVLIAAATLSAGGCLAIVALHVLTD